MADNRDLQSLLGLWLLLLTKGRYSGSYHSISRGQVWELPELAGPQESFPSVYHGDTEAQEEAMAEPRPGQDSAFWSLCFICCWFLSLITKLSPTCCG